MTLNTAATLPILETPVAAPANSPTPTQPDYIAYVGIDWADRKHDIALYDCASDTWEESIIQSRPQDILNWVTQLRAR